MLLDEVADARVADAQLLGQVQPAGGAAAVQARAAGGAAWPVPNRIDPCVAPPSGLCQKLQRKGCRVKQNLLYRKFSSAEDAVDTHRARQHLRRRRRRMGRR